MRFSAWLVLISIDSRRPASWLSAMLAVSAMWMQPVDATITASCAVTAALGDLPKGFGVSVSRMGVLSRLLWPLLGLLVGVCLWIGIVDSRQVFSAIVASSVATLLMVVMLWIVWQQGVAAADSASLCLVVGFISIIFGKVFDSMLLMVLIWVSCIGIIMCLGHWCTKHCFSERLPRRSVEISFGLASRTPARRFLTSTAMVTMLFVMVSWLLLDPRQAPWAVLVGAMWMVCLSGPAVALGDGLVEDDDSPWAWVVRSSSWQWSWFGSVGGWKRTTFETVIRYMAVLGWPALVAAIVSLGSTAGPVPGMVVLGAVVLAGLFVLIAGWICQSLAFSRETSFAVLLSVLAPVIVALNTSNVMNMLQRILSV